MWRDGRETFPQRLFTAPRRFPQVFPSILPSRESAALRVAAAYPQGQATPYNGNKPMSTKDPWEWLAPLAQAWGAQDKLAEQEAVLRWRETRLGPLAQALYVQNGTLHLSVPSHVVAAELSSLQARIIRQVAELAPRSQVRRLRFHVQEWRAVPGQIEVEPPGEGDVRRARRRLPQGVPASVRRAAAVALAWAERRDEAILAAGGWRCPACDLALLPKVERCPACRMERGRLGR